MAEFYEWLRKALIRAVKTGAEVAVGFLGAGTIFADIDWPYMVSAVGLSMVVSLLVSVEGIPEASGGASAPTIWRNAKKRAAQGQGDDSTEV